MITLSGTLDFTPFGEFMISPIHYIYMNVSDLGLCLQINDSGMFAWISRTTWSRTYFVTLSYDLHVRGQYRNI